LSDVKGCDGTHKRNGFDGGLAAMENGDD